MASSSIDGVCGMDSNLLENQTMELELHDLPDLAVENILSYFDIHTLKKLRLVSKSTKEWVEQAKFLEKFKIHISSYEIQEEISNSTEVPWNNFVLTMKKDRPLFQKISSRFAEKFGPSIKHLVINNEGWINFSNNLFKSLIINTSLETLCIKNIALKNYFFIHGAPTWVKNLKKLKTLKIEMAIYLGNDLAEEIHKAKELFDLILRNSSNLTHLHLPTLRLTHLEFDGDVDDWEKSKDLHYQIIVSPLLDYLNRIHSSGKRLNLTIDLDGFKDKEGWMRRIFPISFDSLLELSKMCRKTGAKLHNVNSQSFKNPTTTRKANMNNNIFKEVISSVKMLNHPSGLHGIYLPPCLKIYVEIWVQDPADYSSFELQEPIHSIHFSSFYYPIPENLYSNLFQVVRPSVQELKCDWDMGPRFGEGNLQTIWTGIDITTSFPYLKNLHLEKWGNLYVRADFNVLLTGLPLLERLCLKNCCMNEEGLLGRDPINPIILQLQNLVHVEFIDTNMTDLHLRNAFRFMRLKTFVLKCEEPLSVHHCSNVTFQTGISTLCSIDGGFGDTIEHFDISIPNDCTKDVIDVFVNQFKNLRTYKTCEHCPQRQVPVPDISLLELQETSDTEDCNKYCCGFR